MKNFLFKKSKISNVGLCSIFLFIAFFGFNVTASAASPSVTINQKLGQADPTGVSTALFTVVFSEPISVGTFTTADISTTGSTATGITVNSVTQVAPNDGTTFEVSISATGAGTIVASVPAAVVSYTPTVFATVGTAGVKFPTAIARDASGNTYTSNIGDDTVSKITPGGVVTTLASTGSYPNALIIDPAGNLYTANRNSNNVTKITPSGVSTVFGTTGSSPRGIVRDSAGNLYTANFGGTITKITPAGVSSILATIGSALANITIDSTGNLYTGAWSSGNIYKITPAGVVTTLHTGTLSSNPHAFVVDSAGNVYVNYQSLSNITKITPAGVATVFASSVSVSRGLVIDADGNLYTPNFAGNYLYKITPAGVVTNIGSTGTNSAPYATVIAPNGDLYTANQTGGTVSKFTRSISSGVADLSGLNGNLVSSSTDNSVTYIIDTTPPTATINQAVGQVDPTPSNPINFTVVFSEAINPVTFTAADITLTGTGTATVGTPTTSNNITWNVPVTATASGTIIASLSANKVTDVAGNNNTAATFTDRTVTYDNVPPTATINQAVGQGDPTAANPINFTVVFSEAINPTTFTASDIVLSGTGTATVGTPTTSNNITWNIPVTGTAIGTIIASLPASSITDLAGNSNAVAATFTDRTVTYSNAGITTGPNGAGITILETGSGTISVVLNTQPASNVVLNVTSSDITAATVSPSTMTFTPANWNTPQNITVTGVADADLANESVTVTVTVNDALSSNEYDPVTDKTEPITVTDTNVAGFTVSTTTLTVAENAGTGTYTVVLTSQPTSNVVISNTSSATADATVSPSTLTFTNANWNVPQTVTITAVDDSIDTPADDTANITVSVVDASSDNNFDLLADQTVVVTATDDDNAGFTIVTTDNLTGEDGSTGSFTIVMKTQPTANVSVALSSSDTVEGTVQSSVVFTPATLTFTPANWNTPQTVTMTAVNDVDLANEVTTITATVDDALSSNEFDTVTDKTITVNVTDDDLAGFTISTTTLTVAENAGTVTYTVVLTSQPTTNVVISNTSSATAEATISPSTLTFTSANWNTPQTVTITGVNDSIDTPTDDTANITVSIVDASSDNNFDLLADQTVVVTATDDDTVPISSNTGKTSGSARYCTDTLTTFCRPKSTPVPLEVKPVTIKPSLIGGGEPNVPEEFSPYVCKRYLREYIYSTKQNNPEEVKKLQSFLNEQGEKLTLDGTYDAEDVAAVKRFQEKYRNQILSPWGLREATGVVGRTTAAKINLMSCAKTSCPYFTENLKPGTQSIEAVKLQDFLNIIFAPTSGYPTNGIPLSKTMTPQTVAKVREYQTVYKDSVLKPLGLSSSTGWWYDKSRASANALMNCK
jgi:hypothetical protein